MKAFRGIYIMILMVLILHAILAASIILTTHTATGTLPAILGVGVGALGLLIKALTHKNQ